MNNQIDILDKERMKACLSALRADALPAWGKMTSQQMVEHMVESVEYTNGKKTCTCDRPAEETEAARRQNLHPDFMIPRNVYVGPLPETYCFASVDEAAGQLLRELDDFDTHFNAPGIKSVHFAFGPMDRYEWLIWHGKHFMHHFKQFDVI